MGDWRGYGSEGEMETGSDHRVQGNVAERFSLTMMSLYFCLK